MERTIKSRDAVAGRILWLPPFDEVPKDTVKRVRGTGPIEKGMFNHPVVICSRPDNGSGAVVHFNLITSFRGKTLSEMYGKNSDYHRNKRLGYLPISPAPVHPDGFPSLFLNAGSQLRWESYVNVAEIYEIDLNFLWMYANPETPWVTEYHLGKKSVTQLRKRAESLTKYYIDPQFPVGIFENTTFGVKKLKPDRISTEELEDLQIPPRSVPDSIQRSWIIDIPEHNYPVTEAVIVGCDERYPEPSGKRQHGEVTGLVVAHCEGFNHKPANRTQDVESRASRKPEFLMPQALEPRAEATTGKDQKALRVATEANGARNDDMKGWLDSYVSMITLGLKKVVGFAKWMITHGFGYFVEKDNSPV